MFLQWIKVDILVLSDPDKLEDHRLRPINHGRSLEEIGPNIPLQKGINDSVS